MSPKKTLLALAALVNLAPQARADFTEAKQTPTPRQFQLVPSHYEAGAFKDIDGKEKKVGVTKTGMDATFKAKSERWFYQITIPYLSASSGSQRKEGLGDLTLEAGPHYHIRHWELLPTVRAKLPTGSFEEGRKVNLGTGQTDLSAVLRGTGMYGPLSVDAGMSYTHRLGAPTDRIELRGTPGIGLNKYLRTGIEGVVSLGLDGSRTARVGPGLLFAKDGWQAGSFVQKELGSRQATEGWTYRFILRLPIK